MYIILYHEIENIWFFNMYSSNKEWFYKFFNLILMRFFINVKREWINRLMEFIYNSLKRIYIFFILNAFSSFHRGWLIHDKYHR